MKINKGFTLIELLVVIAIIAILYAIVTFGITEYINRGKDATIKSNLSILIPAGEVYYNHNGVDGYKGFCHITTVQEAFYQIPISGGITSCFADWDDGSGRTDWGICCQVSSTPYIKWAACAKLFSTTNKAFCVDSTGVKREISADNCGYMTECPIN